MSNLTAALEMAFARGREQGQRDVLAVARQALRSTDLHEIENRLHEVSPDRGQPSEATTVPASGRGGRPEGRPQPGVASKNRASPSEAPASG